MEEEFDIAQKGLLSIGEKIKKSIEDTIEQLNSFKKEQNIKFYYGLPGLEHGIDNIPFKHLFSIDSESWHKGKIISIKKLTSKSEETRHMLSDNIIYQIIIEINDFEEHSRLSETKAAAWNGKFETYWNDYLKIHSLKESERLQNIIRNKINNKNLEKNDPVLLKNIFGLGNWNAAIVDSVKTNYDKKIYYFNINGDIIKVPIDKLVDMVRPPFIKQKKRT